MNTTRIAGSALLVVLLAAADWAPARSTAEAEGSEEAPRGRAAFFDFKCNVCHSVSAAGIEAKSKKPGPDLSGYSTDDLATLGRYLRKQEELDGETHKKEFDGSDDELRMIVDWLSGLEPPES